jgi:hypothetical protein
MPSTLVRQKQDDFSVGAQRDIAPSLIDPRGVWDILNGLLEDDGAIYRRGGTVNKSDAAFGAALRWIWDGYLKPGRRTVVANAADFGVLDANDATIVNVGGPGLSAPVAAAELGGLLFIPGGTIYAGSRKSANYTTGTVTLTNGSKLVTGAGTAWLANVDAGMLLRRGSERVYVVESVDSDTQITLEDAYEGATGAGIVYGLTPVRTANTPYESSSIYAVVADRLLTATENKVRFGALDNPHAAFGPDDEHEIPEGVQVLGIAGIGDTAIIFTTAGIWRIDGLAYSIVDTAGNPQHRVQRINADLVLLSGSGVATWQDRLVVPCLDGIYLIDGVSAPRPIAHFTMEKLYREYVERGCRAGGATVFRSHYFLPILDAAGSQVDLLVCRLDRPILVRGLETRPWARLDGQGGTLAALAVRVSTTTPSPVLLGAVNAAAARIVDCSKFFQPDATYKNDADGTTHLLKIITRDYPTGGDTENVVRRLRLRYQMIAADGDNPKLSAEYSSGARIANAPLWDQVNWDEFQWAGGDNTDYAILSGQAPVSDGRTPFVWHLGKRLRHARFRFTQVGPVAQLVIRELDLAIRPSGKER